MVVKYWVCMSKSCTPTLQNRMGCLEELTNYIRVKSDTSVLSLVVMPHVYGIGRTGLCKAPQTLIPVGADMAPFHLICCHHLTHF